MGLDTSLDQLQQRQASLNGMLAILAPVFEALNEDLTVNTNREAAEQAASEAVTAAFAASYPGLTAGESDTFIQQLQALLAALN